MAVLGTASTFLVQRCPRWLRGADRVLGVAAEGTITGELLANDSTWDWLVGVL